MLLNLTVIFTNGIDTVIPKIGATLSQLRLDIALNCCLLVKGHHILSQS